MNKNSINVNNTFSISIAIYLSLFIIGGILQFINSYFTTFWNRFYRLSSVTIFIALVICWGIAVTYRVVLKSLRINLITMTFIIVFWLILKVIKSDFFEVEEPVSRFIRYCDYIPQLFLPSLLLISVINIDRVYHYKSLLLTHLLLLPALIFIVLVLTNDIHELIFIYPEGKENYYLHYEYNTLYSVMMTYMVVTILASPVFLMIKSRSLNTKPKFKLVLVYLIIIFILCVSCYISNNRVFKITELFSFSIIGLVEVLIQTGYIQCNKNHALYLDSSITSIIITDRNNNIKFSSHRTSYMNNDEVIKLVNEGTTINNNIRFRKANVHGGYVYFSENISHINTVNNQLSEVVKQLSEENEIILAENNLKESITIVEEQNRLYDVITFLVQDKLLLLNELLDKTYEESLDFTENIKKACLYGAYIKRRSNLAIVGRKHQKVHSDELLYSIRELTLYLEFYGVYSSINFEGKYIIDYNIAKFILAFYEECVEISLKDLHFLLVTLKITPNEINFRINIDTVKHIKNINYDDELLSMYNGKVTTCKQDDSYYIDLAFKGGVYQ